MVAGRFQNGAFVPYAYEDTIRQRHKAPARVDPRERRQIKFWVDVRKELGEWAVETMDALKQERKFKETMLQGFRLIVDLRHKKIDYLFDLFPWIEAWMDGQIEAEVSRRVALAVKERSAGQGDLEKRLAKLEALLASQTTTPATPAPTLQPVAPRPATDDDDSALLTITKAAPNQDTASAKSFIDAAFSLQS